MGDLQFTIAIHAGCGPGGSVSRTSIIPSVNLGRTGRVVTRVGLGGEGVLRTRGREAEAEAVIEAALAAGLGYFDTARVYDDSERYYQGHRCFLSQRKLPEERRAQLFPSYRG